MSRIKLYGFVPIRECAVIIRFPGHGITPVKIGRRVIGLNLYGLVIIRDGAIIVLVLINYVPPLSKKDE